MSVTYLSADASNGLVVHKSGLGIDGGGVLAEVLGDEVQALGLLGITCLSLTAHQQLINLRTICLKHSELIFDIVRQRVSKTQNHTLHLLLGKLGLQLRADLSGNVDAKTVQDLVMLRLGNRTTYGRNKELDMSDQSTIVGLHNQAKYQPSARQ